MEDFDPTKVALYVRLAIFGIFLILVLVFVLRTRNSSKGEPKKSQQENVKLESTHGTDVHILANLVILASDDPSFVNKVLHIIRYPVTLGQAPHNDFVFPVDSPVSNFHAKLFISDGKVMLSEIVITAQGIEKRPTYGTFVNGKPLREQSIELMDGDEIQLGPRLRLLFEQVDLSRLPGTVDEKYVRKRGL